MPRIFDNIESKLLPALQNTIDSSDNADFCVGYFNLRGWKQIDKFIDNWSGGEGHCCRLLVGMQSTPDEELRVSLRLLRTAEMMDNKTAQQLKKQLAEGFRRQLALGAPTNEDEDGLRRLSKQIREKKVIVRLFLRHPLHAKLYLLFKPDQDNPMVGYLGSSNLTMAGLSAQGELNLDVLDHDACTKLSKWFNDRWDDKWCVDISNELAQIIDSSWAAPAPLSPYLIYVKMAYSLSEEAREGITDFRIPSIFGSKLLEFQTAAVKIAAHHINRREGVLLGDVVGLGKTLMATAVAKIFEDDHGLETLIICPKNIVKMWEQYRDTYHLRGRVMSISKVLNELEDLPRFRLVIVDESHNLRNREGKRYSAIKDYIEKNECKCIMLSATPYNKVYLDLSSQLRLFVQEEKDLGVRPEKLLHELGETEFIRQHQCPLRSLSAFEKSGHPEDWRELMRLYMIRRTRSFIMSNYAEEDPENGRKYLTLDDGTRSYFPVRIPRTVKFKTDARDRDDQFARLYSDEVVTKINALCLPRYGMGNYLAPTPSIPITQTETKIVHDLSRAGKRLMGFCRTNLFKRLESSGYAFVQSIERHILRNFVFMYALEKDLPLPLGRQDAELLDSQFFDEDIDAADFGIGEIPYDNDNGDEKQNRAHGLRAERDFRRAAEQVYKSYTRRYKTRFSWIRPNLFVEDLRKDLKSDVENLMGVLRRYGDWIPEKDKKLDALEELIEKRHPNDKILVFSQFSDTVHYLDSQLRKRGIQRLAGVTGDTDDPTEIAWRFSPRSNEKEDRIPPGDRLRVVIATDVLSEGQNLQDCAIVVNYDLPWAIIRLIQRAGRVDRIGQLAENILCYSFLPADGVERIIRLRSRVRERLSENAEVVGTDEAFFEDDGGGGQRILDLYNENAGILDGDYDSEVDLSSYAYQIWRDATARDPALLRIVPELPAVAYSTRGHLPTEGKPNGVLAYLRTAQENDVLAWIDKKGKNITESQFEILKAAECDPDTPALPRMDKHHELVRKALELVRKSDRSIGGQLGRPSGARFRAYERLKKYAERVRGTLRDSKDLRDTIDCIYRHPLRQSAIDTLNRQLRSGVTDEDLAQLVVTLHREDRLCAVQEEMEDGDAKIICSLGLSDE